MKLSLKKALRAAVLAALTTMALTAFASAVRTAISPSSM